MKTIRMNSAEYSDTEILEGIRNGDRMVLKAFYKKYFDRIKLFVLANSGKEQDAEDLFQEVTVALYRNVKKTDFVLTSELYTYLFAISKRLWYKRLKKTQKEQSLLNSKLAVSETQLEFLEESERFYLYRMKFRLLGEKCKKILALFFQKKKMSEIAEIMCVTPGYAKKRKYKCKEKLIGLIQNDPRFDELKKS